MAEKISKNYEKGKLITDPFKIVELAKNRKAIYVTKWCRTSPAAVILSMQFRMVLKWIEAESFYELKRTRPRKIRPTGIFDNN